LWAVKADPQATLQVAGIGNTFLLTWQEVAKDRKEKR